MAIKAIGSLVIDHDLQYLKNLILSGKATCKATCKLYLRNIAKFIWMEFPLQFFILVIQLNCVDIKCLGARKCQKEEFIYRY